MTKSKPSRWAAVERTARGPLWRPLLAALCALLLLAGCSAIPTSGPVQQGDEPLSGDISNPVGYNPDGPKPDDSPQQIVEGFINAGTGTENNYRTARKFLAPGLADSWRPDARTWVYQGFPNIVPGPGENTFSVTFDLVRVIDGEGISRPASEIGEDTVEFTLTQLPEGHWRISEAPDGIMLSSDSFSRVFDSHKLYFYSPNYKYAVPDVRWFARGASVPASLVRAMLLGPAPYLKGAVVSAFNDGTTLASPSVAVDSGEALVDLAAGAVDGASALQRQRMQTQLEMTLLQLNNVSAIDMTIEQREVPLPEGGEPVSPIQDADVPATQVALRNGELAIYENLNVSQPRNLAEISQYSPRDPAISYEQRWIGFLNGKRSKLFVTARDQNVDNVLSGELLTEPTFDPYNWLWTAEATRSGEIFAVAAGTDPPAVSTVSADWIEGTVTDLKISRDGARALVITNSGDSSEAMIAGVLRDEDGVPTELTQPMYLDPSVPVDRGAWVDETSVAVIEASETEDVQAEILSLDSESNRITGLEGMTHISAGNGRQQIYGQTGDYIYLQVGNSWSRKTKNVVDPSFPG